MNIKLTMQSYAQVSKNQIDYRIKLANKHLIDLEIGGTAKVYVEPVYL